MVDDQIAAGVQEILAANLRRLRIARHLSLSELARATGMSKATLSGIENGRANPTVETLASLAGTLRTSVTELLEEPALAEIRIVRRTKLAPANGDGPSQRLLDQIPQGGSFEVAEVALPPHHEREIGPGAMRSRAHLYVLQGSLVAGPIERVTELVSGDYASFPADVPWIYETGRHAARALLLRQGPS